MNDMDLFWLVLYGLACFGLGRWYQLHRMIRGLIDNRERIREILERYAREDAQATQTADTDKEIIMVNVEWHNDHCYLFRQDNGQFLGQGSDISTAIQSANSRLTAGIEYKIAADMAKKPLENQP